MNTLSGMEKLILTAIILVLTASWRLYQKRKYYRSVTSKLPTFYGIPFFGVTYQVLDVNKLFRSISSGYDVLKTATACAWVATTPYVLTIDPEVVKRVTTSPEFLHKATDLYTHFHNGVLNGIIVSPAEKWKINRKAISPFLAHSNIIALFPAFNENANNVKNKLARLAGLGEQDIFTIIKECVLQLSFLTVLGTKIEEGTEKHKELLRQFNAFVDYMKLDLWFGQLGLVFLSRTPRYKRIIKYLCDPVRSLIKEKLSRKGESEAVNNLEQNQQTVIDLAVKSMRQGVFSEKDVEIESFTMFAASLETSASAAYTCLVMLAMHPEIQERVFQEVRFVFPDGVTAVKYDDLQKLRYLDMFVSESLRLVPPITYTGRQTVRDTELCPGVILPKGTQVFVPIYELHRCKEIWGPDSGRFNPDNFLPENIAKRHPYSYMPFSKGSRNCIGFRYAEISLRMTLIHAVRNFKFSTTSKYEDIVFVPDITLSYKIPPLLSIETREN
ncbi:probable cytochrome P450 313a4 isoform X2 [Bactrocera tryoni]|uniref:probable cytochrome P450 313a4 isoform X2 n=1 Tax=Bactrocera tryoni TaxID=59916 RepID=UPI001A972F58|nr:probable cytochrome P450 313a4 isoform X2 [Bactrocera tryoni]